MYWIVPDFGDRSLDMDPNFFRYRYSCGTIINVHTYIHPNKIGTKHYLRK